MTDNKLLKLCEWMEKKPTVGGRCEGATSPEGWWFYCWQGGGNYEWQPAKDPRKDIKAAMEVFNKFRLNDQHPTLTGNSTGCRSTVEYHGVIMKVFIGHGDTPEQAICNAVIELIDYFDKEKTNG